MSREATGKPTVGPGVSSQPVRVELRQEWEQENVERKVSGNRNLGVLLKSLCQRGEHAEAAEGIGHKVGSRSGPAGVGEVTHDRGSSRAM